MIFLEITQLCNICFTNLNNKKLTEDIRDVVAETLKRYGLIVLQESGLSANSDYIRVYKEKGSMATGFKQKDLYKEVNDI